MKKREKTFCLYVSQGKTLEEASHLAGYKDITIGNSLIVRSDILDEISCLLNAKTKLMKMLSAVGYERLAFGSIKDCITLIKNETFKPEQLDNMDLFMISEIKKPKDGAMEIKFFDRLKALEKLSNMGDEGKGSLPFYQALELGAKALGDKYE